MNQIITISVVIPCRNEAPYIKECIDAIFASEVNQEVRIHAFVVDGMSDDGTREIVQELMDIYPQLHLIDNPQKTTPFAFNLGVKAQTCDYIQRVDARHIISTNYIQNALNILQTDKTVWCVGGKIFNEYINETGRVIATAMGTSLGMGLGNFRTLQKSGFTDTVTSPMYPIWVFEKIGYFDEDLIRNQDDDFNYRVTKAGGKIYFDASISLKYYVRGNFKNLWKQFNQYGYWKVFVNRKHKAVTTLRQMVPPLFVLYLAVFVLSWFLGGLIGSISSLPLMIYLALVIYVSYDLSNKDKSISIFELVKTFPILHLSYGLGYLQGIWQFLILRRNASDKAKTLTR